MIIFSEQRELRAERELMEVKEAVIELLGF
jgi:hypothetical protein